MDGDNLTSVRRSSRNVKPPDHLWFYASTAVSVEKEPLSTVEALNSVKREKQVEAMGKRDELYMFQQYLGFSAATEGSQSHWMYISGYSNEKRMQMD